MEINKEYTAHPRYKIIKGLPFTIEEDPREYPKEKVPPYAQESIFTHFDDEKIIMKHPTDKGGHTLWVLSR